MEVRPIANRDGEINIKRSAPWPEAKHMSQDDLARGGSCQEIAGVVFVRDCIDLPDDFEDKCIDAVMGNF